MLNKKDANGIAIYSSSYVPKCTNIASGNIFVNKAKAKFVKEGIKSIVAVEKGEEKADRFTYVSTCPFGEVIALAGTGANTAVVTVTGKDYLGQPMVEEITLNGATAVSGKKAFKSVTCFELEAEAATDIKISNTGKVGLEFANAGTDVVLKNGVKNSTVAASVMERTQTATSNDPRGVLDMTSCAEGDVVEVTYNVTDFVADDKGGLFGVPHYAG